MSSTNQGAAIARQLSSLGMFKWIAGEGAMELGPDWDEFSKVCYPAFPFSIGGRGRIDDSKSSSGSGE